jgi:type II secretory pathway component PulF
MKKFFALCMALAMVVNTTNAAFTETKAEGVAEKKESYGSFKNAETKAMAEMFVKMSRKEYEEITGRHLSLMERAAFKIQQKHIKHELRRATGDATNAVVGFVAGFFVIGLLLVLLLSNDPLMRKWAIIGGVIGLIFFGLILF